MKLGKHRELLADQDGLRIVQATEQQPLLPLSSGEQLLLGLPSLISDGIFEKQGEDFIASLENLLLLESRESDPLNSFLEWSPLLLKIEGRNAIGFDDFKYVPRFYLGKRTVQIKTSGIIAWRGQSIFRIPASQALALNLIEQFNNSSKEEKSKAKSLNHLYNLKLIASGTSSITFDDYLLSEVVVKPQSINLKAHDDGKRAVIYPTIDGTSEVSLKNQFLNITDVQDVYDVESKDGMGRQRLIISKELKEVLKSVKRSGFGITGQSREEFFRNPRSILPEGEERNPDLIQLVGFGPRVKGIGYASFARPVSSSTKEKWFGEKTSPPSPSSLNTISIECAFVDGELKNIDFQSTEEAEEFLSTVRSNLAKGDKSIEYNGINIPISPSFASILSEEIENTKPSLPAVREPTKPHRLLIHTNEENLDYAEETNHASSTFSMVLPKSLKLNVVLKEHQKVGIGWLSGLISRDLSKGALLADDMGLGKTLQILTFLAWCIEHEIDQLSSDEGPYDPILVVAPLILLDNWEKEIIRYFEPGLFSPLVKLHGSSLKKYRKIAIPGKETTPGEETLNIDEIRKNRIIITNYETVKNYQYTFAKIPWSVVVVDEAQEIKEPSTAVTYALKVLNPTFRVASTGTPVETSLTNLWSIMDFVQPGNSLGSLRYFNKNFGEFSYDDPALGNRLRDALGFNTESGLVLRRAKKDVLKDLPPKSVIEHECPIDPVVKNYFSNIIKFVQESPKGSAAALQGLHQIAQVSQHPFLIEGDSFRADYNEYVKASSKLQKLLSILRDIELKKEKALIFTRSRKMQDILKAVLDAEFNLDTGIINGDTASRHNYVSNTREGIIDRFSSTEGFNVLILSPEVAGVGLTITAANHVIHYGRWWNPAKENQATDRAYRIGQTKPVFVHHLILKDPDGETFDEKLHRLLKVREDLADNFLAPSGDESAVQTDLMNNLFVGNKSNPKKPPINIKPILSRATPYEFECICALVMKGRFNEIFVTPRSGDRGIDILGISRTEVALIQCKMTGPDQICQPHVLEEIVDGADYYREFVIPKTINSLPLKTILITTGKFDRSTIGIAKAKSIELVDGSAFNRLLADTDITISDVSTLDSDRPRNVDILAENLKRFCQRVETK